jgi:hypothetical protein
MPSLPQAGIIITARMALIAMASLISNQGYFLSISCDQLASRYLLGSQEMVLSRFPTCEAYFSGNNPNQVVPVEAAMSDGGAEGARAALNISFGAALWLALFIHAVGIEIYVRSSFHIHCRTPNNVVL